MPVYRAPPCDFLQEDIICCRVFTQFVELSRRNDTGYFELFSTRPGLTRYKVIHVFGTFFDHRVPIIFDNNNIFTEKQKGCKRRSRTKHQLLMDKAVRAEGLYNLQK